MKELSKLEQQVMNVVWTLGECSSSEVIAAFRKQRTLADSTIRTVLANLRQKKYVERVPSVERGFRLRPCVSRKTVANRLLKDLVANILGGSPHEAVLYLLKNEDIPEGELAEIRQRIERARKKSVTKKKRSN